MNLKVIYKVFKKFMQNQQEKINFYSKDKETKRKFKEQISKNYLGKITEKGVTSNKDFGT